MDRTVSIHGRTEMQKEVWDREMAELAECLNEFNELKKPVSYIYPSSETLFKGG